MKRALWAINGLLGVGILIFARTHLVFPAKIPYLADIDPTAALPSPPPKPGDQPNEQVLITLRNPLRAGETPKAPPLPSMVLHGALPTMSGQQGVAFVRTAENVSLVVPIGEEIQGWRLAELWKDRALFTDAEGRTLALDLTSNPHARSRNPE
jgi:hypothetical protein